MPELTTLDVQNYTQGRLNKDDTETTRLLAAAHGAARRYCGWHVTPVRTAEDFTVDGPGTPLLVLPTLSLAEITEMFEDGETVDLDYIDVSRRGLVRKKAGYPALWPNGYLWSCKFSAITGKMTHGFAEAPEWQSAVLSLIDRISMDVGLPGRPRVIGPFQYETSAAASGLFTESERMLLDMYRLEAAP